MNKAHNTDKPTVPAGSVIRIALTPEQHRDLRVCSVITGRTITAILTEAALDYIAKHSYLLPVQNKLHKIQNNA